MTEQNEVKTTLVPGVPWPAKDTPVRGYRREMMFQKWETVAHALSQSLMPYTPKEKK